MKKTLLFLLALVLLTSACSQFRETPKAESEIQVEIENEEKPTELTVYAVGDSVFLRKLGGTEAFKYYITSYTIGPFGPLTNAIREYGHMLYGPLERYEQEAGINLNVQFFQNMETMETQIVKDKKEGKRPDAFRIYLQLTDMVMVWYDVLVTNIHTSEFLSQEHHTKP